MLMRSHHGRVDHQRAKILGRAQLLPDGLPTTCAAPAAETCIGGMPVPQVAGQVSPRRARARNPQHRFDELAVVTGPGTAVAHFAGQQGLDLAPLLIAQCLSCHVFHSKIKPWSIQTIVNTPYIFDRQGGGRFEWFRNLFSDHSDWFALYAIDGKIDDETFCNNLARGRFRLHPKGPRGISEGCITIEKLSDFQFIRAMLKSIPPSAVPGSDLKAYGKVVVK